MPPEFYPPSNRKDLLSFKAALGIPLGAALIVGSLFGFAVAMLIRRRFPCCWIDASLFCAAAVTLVSFLVMHLKWWRVKLNNADADLFDLQKSVYLGQQPVVISLPQKTPGGYQAPREKPPASYAQVLLIARTITATGRINLDSLAAILGPKQASVYRDWMVGNDHAMWKNESAPTLGVVVTEKGKEYYANIVKHGANYPTPYPTDGEIIELTRDS